MLKNTIDSVEVLPPNPIRCHGCGELKPSYDIIHYGSIEQGYRLLCSGCFNTEAAQLAGLKDFQHVDLQPVGLADCVGVLHEFHFRLRLFVPGVALDAFELLDGSPAGYQFQIIGDPEEDLLVLLGRLIEKMRRALSVKYLTDDEGKPQMANNPVLCGRIEWDEASDGRVPRLVIDGREISWNEFGRILMSSEGFQFKLSIADQSDEL